jgi:hemerythrin superfamily protein
VPSMTNAVSMLKEDHQKVKGLFQRFESADESEKEKIFNEIFRELEIHTTVEEEIFYPAMRKLESEMIAESLEEHNIFDFILGGMKKVKASDESYEAKFTTLKENVEHHMEEEEGEMFPKAEQSLGGQLAELGQKMMERKEALMKNGSRSSNSSRSTSGTRSRTATRGRSRSGSKSGSRG